MDIYLQNRLQKVMIIASQLWLFWDMNAQINNIEIDN